MFKKSVISSIILSSLALTGCGDGNSSGSNNDSNNASARTYSGQVADGYLYRAKVCADVNDNEICDSDEPSVETDEQGRYNLITSLSFKDVVIQAEKGKTVDQDTGKTVSESYKLLAPKDDAKFVSPLTTLAYKISKKNGVSFKEGLSTVAIDLGLNPYQANLLKENFIDPEDHKENEYLAQLQKLRKVAVAATTVMRKRIKDYKDNSGRPSDGNDYRAMELGLEDVLDNIKQISQQVSSSDVDIATLHDENNQFFNSIQLGELKPYSYVGNPAGGNSYGDGPDSLSGNVPSGGLGTYLSKCDINGEEGTAGARTYKFTSDGKVQLGVVSFYGTDAAFDCENGNISKAFINIPIGSGIEPTYKITDLDLLDTPNGTTFSMNLKVQYSPEYSVVGRVAKVNGGEYLCFGQDEGYYSSKTSFYGSKSNQSLGFFNSTLLAFHKNLSDVGKTVDVSTYDHCLKRAN